MKETHAKARATLRKRQANRKRLAKEAKRAKKLGAQNLKAASTMARGKEAS